MIGRITRGLSSLKTVRHWDKSVSPVVCGIFNQGVEIGVVWRTVSQEGQTKYVAWLLGPPPNPQDGPFIGEGSTIDSAMRAARNWIRKQGANIAQRVVPDLPGRTSFEQRFIHALTLLARGHVPPTAAVREWQVKGSDGHALQHWAINHGPSWCQGIELIDAAMALAKTPEEGRGHT